MPLAEHDLEEALKVLPGTSFNSRAPRGARLLDGDAGASADKFQFTCPSRSTTGRLGDFLLGGLVSIHVPLAEHDEENGHQGNAGEVSIHVPLAEHDRNISYIV